MSILSHFRRYRTSLKTSDGRIAYFNFWNKQPAEEIWFTEFLRARYYFDRYPDVKFAFFSTLGSPKLLITDHIIHCLDSHRKYIFYTGENVHCQSFVNYQENMLNYEAIDLSMGFDYVKNNRYLRFPLWILEMIPPSASHEKIKDICERLSSQHYCESRDRFCALVSGNRGAQDSGVLLRTEIVGHIEVISHVDCAGKLLNNTDELHGKFHNDKSEFLKQYKFYICPENTSVEGYVTEKIFHSIGSGCIPIYYGSLNNPEPDVLNHDAIIFWNQNGDNAAAINKVEELWNNPKLYKEFFEQPRLQPHAWEVVAEYFNMLEKKLDEICRRC